MTLSLRERSPDWRRAHLAASPKARLTLKLTPMMVGLALFLAVAGIGAAGAGLLARTLQILTVIAIAYAAGMWLTARLQRLRGFIDQPVRMWIAAGVLMIAPMGVLAWAADWLLAEPAPTAADFLDYLALGLVAAPVGCLTVALVAARPKSNASQRVAPSPFFARLPHKHRGADLWAVEAQDHYLRLHTSAGQGLILMGLREAVGELEDLEGAQVHRSWWVAREAVRGAERIDGRWVLRLPNGGIAPVSRRCVKTLRDREWF